MSKCADLFDLCEDQRGENALWIASSEQQEVVLQLLLERGADASTVNNVGCSQEPWYKWLLILALLFIFISSVSS